MLPRQPFRKRYHYLNGQVPLRIIGDGPLATFVRQEAASDPAIEWLGNLPLEAVYRLIGDADIVIVPSECFEGFPRVVADAFAKGTPVIASRIGAMLELIEDGRTGLLFTPGEPRGLARAVREILANPQTLASMRRSARAQFEHHFTAELNHQALMAIYTRATAERARTNRPQYQQRHTAWI